MLAGLSQPESTDGDTQNSPQLKAVELPDCDLAAKHFISQGFWEQSKPNGLNPTHKTAHAKTPHN